MTQRTLIKCKLCDATYSTQAEVSQHLEHSCRMNTARGERDALRAEVERLRGVLLEVGRAQRSKDRTYSNYTELLVTDDLIEKIEKEFDVPLKGWLMGGDEEG